QGTEAIVYGVLAFGAFHVAERLQIPCYGAFLQPHSRTRAFPAFPLPGPLERLGSLNWLSHLLAAQLFWQPFRVPINRWRQRTLGLPPAPYFGLAGPMRARRVPILYGYSSLVAPRPPDWPRRLHATGYWFLDRPAEWEPPARLVDFLAAGPA